MLSIAGRKNAKAFLSLIMQTTSVALAAFTITGSCNNNKEYSSNTNPPDSSITFNILERTSCADLKGDWTVVAHNSNNIGNTFTESWTINCEEDGKTSIYFGEDSPIFKNIDGVTGEISGHSLKFSISNLDYRYEVSLLKTKSGFTGIIEFQDIKEARARGIFIPINYFVNLKRK